MKNLFCVKTSSNNFTNQKQFVEKKEGGFKYLQFE